MVKLHAQLENLLKIRINSNSEIIPAMKRLSEMGKFDKPKELAMFAVILDRLGKLEDEAAIEESLKADDINKIGESTLDPIDVPETLAINEATTSPDASTTPGITEPVQTPIETSTSEVDLNKNLVMDVSDMPTTETPVNNEVIDDEVGTISEFTPENIAATPIPETQMDIPSQPIQPPADPATSS